MSQMSRPNPCRKCPNVSTQINVSTNPIQCRKCPNVATQEPTSSLWLPVISAVNLQRLFIAGDIAHHRIGGYTSEDRRSGAQRHAAKLAVLYLEGKRGGRFSLGIGSGSYAAKFWECAQILP